MKILYAEDEKDLQEVTADYLRYQGFDVVAVDNGQEAVDKAATESFDIIVMDIMMPVMDGVTAMKKMREAGNTLPALFLTAKSEVSDRVGGLNAGADDYLTKPFSLEELNARINALGRRKREYKVRTLSFGNVTLNTETSELKAQNSIDLAAKEVRLLSYVISNSEKTISSGELLKEVWSDEDAVDDTVWIYISFLKAKLQSIGADFTIDGNKDEGYKITVLEK